MVMPSALPAYAELHCLSAFSFQRGASTALELFEREGDDGGAGEPRADGDRRRGDEEREEGERLHVGLEPVPGRLDRGPGVGAGLRGGRDERVGRPDLVDQLGPLGPDGGGGHAGVGVVGTLRREVLAAEAEVLAQRRVEVDAEERRADVLGGPVADVVGAAVEVVLLHVSTVVGLGVGVAGETEGEAEALHRLQGEAEPRFVVRRAGPVAGAVVGAGF